MPCPDGDTCRYAHGFDELRQPGEDFTTEYLPRLMQKMTHVSEFKIVEDQKADGQVEGELAASFIIVQEAVEAQIREQQQEKAFDEQIAMALKASNASIELQQVSQQEIMDIANSNAASSQKSVQINMPKQNKIFQVPVDEQTTIAQLKTKIEEL